MDCVLGPGFAFEAEPPHPPRREIYQRSMAVISPPKTQKLVLKDPVFVVLRFE